MGGLLERTALLTSAKWSYLITAQTKLEKKKVISSLINPL